MNHGPLVYYVSGHGLGHASRASQVIRELPCDLPVIVKSLAPGEFFRRESGRSDVQVFPMRFDVGAVQKTNREIDWVQTYEQVLSLHRGAEDLLESEVEYLRNCNARAVVSDVPPLPLKAAQLCGIPSCLIANFTWVEIYKRGLKSFHGGAEVVSALKRQYLSADLSLVTPPSFSMSYLPNRHRIALVARTGTCTREKLRQSLGVGARAKLVLLYLGDWGDSALDWNRISEEQGDIVYLAFSAMPAPVLKLEPSDWSFPDVVASVDAVLAKPGYGTAGECMANGTPLVYYPRPEFAEYRVLQRDLVRWGGGICLSTRCFASGRWRSALEAAFLMRPVRLDASGASQAAQLILDLCTDHVSLRS